MPELTLNIDRLIDSEIALVKCFLGGVEIKEVFSFDPALTDAEITTQVTDNLIAKEYNIT